MELNNQAPLAQQAQALPTQPIQAPSAQPTQQVLVNGITTNQVPVVVTMEQVTQILISRQ